MTIRALARGYDRLLAALAILACVAVAGIFALIVIDVAARELFGSSLNYTIGIVEYGLLYMTMLAAPYLLRIRGHIRITSIVSRLPAPARRRFGQFINLVCAAGTGVLAYISVVLLIEKIQSGNIDIRGIDFPTWLLALPLPLGYALLSIEFLRTMFDKEESDPLEPGQSSL